MHLNCKDWKTLWRKQRLQKCPNGQVTTIFARSPKSRIFWKSAKGGPKEILKYRPKRCPRLKGPKALWRKWHYPLICMHLKCKDCRRFSHKQRLKKGPNSEVMTIFWEGHPKPAFSEKAQRGDQEKFFKNRPKNTLASKGQQHSAANVIIL